MVAKPDPDALVAKYGKGKTPGKPCPIPASGKTELIEALRLRGVEYPRISEILKAEFGLELRAHSLGRHLSKRCKCQV